MSALGLTCASYAVFALATFVWIAAVTCRDKQETAAWVAQVTVSVLWPAFWIGVLCIYVANRHLQDTGYWETEERDGRHS